MKGEKPDLVLALFPLGDVSDRSRHQICPAVAIPPGQASRGDPAIVTTLGPDPVFAVAIGRAAFQMLGYRLVVVCTVIGVNQFQPGMGVRQKVLVVTQYVEQTFADFQPFGARIPRPEAVVGARHGEVVRAAASFQLDHQAQRQRQGQQQQGAGDHGQKPEGTGRCRTPNVRQQFPRPGRSDRLADLQMGCR